MTEPNPDEKRRHPRYPVCISCEVTRGGETLYAETKNLSTGGAAILLSEEIGVGEVLTVSFFLTQDGIEDANRPPFECAASIRWTKPEGDQFAAGLQFMAPSTEQRSLLVEFLKRWQGSTP